MLSALVSLPWVLGQGSERFPNFCIEYPHRPAIRCKGFWSSGWLVFQIKILQSCSFFVEYFIDSPILMLGLAKVLTGFNYALLKHPLSDILILTQLEQLLLKVIPLNLESLRLLQELLPVFFEALLKLFYFLHLQSGSLSLRTILHHISSLAL